MRNRVENTPRRIKASKDLQISAKAAASTKRTLIGKRQLANDKAGPRHGKEQVKPLARAN
jgi:hypothetical protein